MRAIREVRPDAQLVQTEDLGRIWSTPELETTCDLLNERRWLPYDLLCGTVDQFHPLFLYLRDAGIPEHEILWFRDNPCPPDIVGMNYYVTSDRFIDHRVDLYSENRRSGEGPFVDVEAVRVRAEGIAGFDSLLMEAWERYRLPIALTEVHLGCSVDEQIRWASEAWSGAIRARQAGADCLALTFWALLGSFFWNTLVTSSEGHYEPGVFDVSAGTPVATDLAKIVAQCASGEMLDDPALSRQGWWRNPNRLLFHAPAEGSCTERELAA
jgi:dTDP-4-dehydrorhamnose reductase